MRLKSAALKKLCVKGKEHSRLKYESSVHRVQGVPETESGGRVRPSGCFSCGNARSR